MLLESFSSDFQFTTTTCYITRMRDCELRTCSICCRVSMNVSYNDKGHSLHLRLIPTMHAKHFTMAVFLVVSVHQPQTRCAMLAGTRISRESFKHRNGEMPPTANSFIHLITYLPDCIRKALQSLSQYVKVELIWYAYLSSYVMENLDFSHEEF